MANPLLSDLPAHKLKFEAGDRIIARVSVALSKSQYRRLARAIQTFARADVNVIIVNCLQTVIIHVDRATAQRTVIASPVHARHQDIAAGVANLDCAVVKMKSNDMLFVAVPRISSEPQRNTIKKWVGGWAGKDIEVIVQEGKF